MKLKTLLLGPFLFCILWFLGWEAYAVWDARQKTETIFAEAQNEVRVKWQDLSAEFQDILLTVEDPSFMTHRGVDFETPGAGLSTITQELAGALYFKKFTPGFSEIERSLIAFFVIDPKVEKADQLDVFLNIADFGVHNSAPLLGFDAAARVYLGKSLGRLTRFEFIQLVAMLEDPVRFSIKGSQNARRVSKIEAVLAGKCTPKSRRDVLYEAC